MNVTHALTVRIPWAPAIALGFKPLENRRRRPALSLLGKWFAIHAGQHDDGPEAHAFVRRVAGRSLEPKDIHPGRLVAVTRLVGVARISGTAPDFAVELRPEEVADMAAARAALEQGRPWLVDVREHPEGFWFAWLLADTLALPPSIPFRGNFGLQPLPPAAQAEIAQLTSTARSCTP